MQANSSGLPPTGHLWHFVEQASNRGEGIIESKLKGLKAQSAGHRALRSSNSAIPMAPSSGRSSVPILSLVMLLAS